MSTEAHKFKVGLFIIGALVIGVGVMIWLGVTRFFSETRPYVTYYAESVQGLEVGSQVKFMGVVVGNVSRVRVAPDGRLVEVVMAINAKSSFVKTDDMRTELAMAGITGMKYVEITRAPEALPLPLSFPPPADYIPSRASMFSDVMTAIKGVYDNVMNIDFKGISDEAKGSLTAVKGRVSDPNIDRLVDELARSAHRLRTLLEKKDTEDILVQAGAAVAELKGLVEAAHTQVAGTDLKGTVAQFQDTLFNLNQLIERVDGDMADVMLNLRRTTSTLAHVAQKLDSGEPSQLLLGEPPPERIILENETHEMPAIPAPKEESQ